jgi:hypothetical protein
VSSASAAEISRWLRVLALPFFGPCAAIAATFATGYEWLMAPAVVLGPGLGIVALTYLALSSDSVNDVAGEVVVLVRENEQLERAA